VAFLAFNAFGDGINNSLPSGQRAAFTNMTGVYR
jgi:hypothetical protein